MKKYKLEYGGGPKPIVTTNPNDKRLKAYKDSLSLYNRGLDRRITAQKQAQDQIKNWIADGGMVPPTVVETGTNGSDSPMFMNMHTKNGIRPTEKGRFTYKGGDAREFPLNDYLFPMYKRPQQSVTYKPENPISPYITSNPNDKRIRAYRDSLNAFSNNAILKNSSEEIARKTMKNRGVVNTPLEFSQYQKGTQWFNNFNQGESWSNTKIKPTSFEEYRYTGKDGSSYGWPYPIYAKPRQQVIYRPDVKEEFESWGTATPALSNLNFKGTIDNISHDPSFPDPNAKFSAPTQGNTELYQDYVNRVHSDKMKYYTNQKKMLYGGNPIDPLTPKRKYTIDPLSSSKLANIDPSRVQNFQNVDQLAGTEPSVQQESSFDLGAAARTVGDTIGTIGKVGNMVAKTISTGLDVGNSVLGEIDTARLSREEQARIAQSLLKRPYDSNNQILNNIPVYTQFGGEPGANVEAEDGEILQRSTGHIFEAEGDRHEQGGETFANIDRVLEDTAGKRKDPLSKALVIPKEEAKEITGTAVKKGLSHAEVFKRWSDSTQKIQEKQVKNIGKIEKQRDPNIYSVNSAKLNAEFGATMPSGQAMFDLLFAHQEGVKEDHELSKYAVGEEDELPQAAYGLNLKGPKPKKYKPYDRAKQGNFSMKAGEMVNYGDPSSYLNVNGLPVDLTPEQQEAAMAYQLSQSVTNPSTPPVFTPEQLQRAGISPKSEVSQGEPSMRFTKPPFTLKDQPTSKLDNPLNWYDTIGPVAGLLNAMARDPQLYNQVNFRNVKYALQDPRAQLANNQADYNAAKANLSNSSVGNAQAAQLFSNKLKADNQVIGQTQNANTQIQNSQENANADITQKQELADANSRQLFYTAVLQARAKQTQAKQDALNQLADNIGKHNSFNKTAELIMKLSPNFDQNADYNGRQTVVTNNGAGVGVSGQIPPGTEVYKVTDKNGKVTTEYLNEKEYQLRLKSSRYSKLSRLS